VLIIGDATAERDGVAPQSEPAGGVIECKAVEGGAGREIVRVRCPNGAGEDKQVVGGGNRVPVRGRLPSASVAAAGPGRGAGVQGGRSQAEQGDEAEQGGD